MTRLFQIPGSSGTPALPAPFNPGPDGSDTVSGTGGGVKGSPVSLSCTGGWNVVPSPSIGSLDNNLAAVSAGSATHAWAVGSYYTSNNPHVLPAMGEHFDGTTWAQLPPPAPPPHPNPPPPPPHPPPP